MQTFIPDQAIEKKCPRCHLVKSIDCFYNDKRSTDGHTSHCKICNDEASKKRQVRLHPKKTLTDYKFCPYCGEKKQIKEFVYNKCNDGSRGGSRICHSCYIINARKPIPEQKACAACGETKPIKEFIYSKKSSGLRGGSKVCVSCYHLSAAKYSRENADLQKYQKYYNRHQSQLKHIQDKLRYINDCFCRLHGYNRKLIYKQKSRSENRLDKLSELIKNDLSNIHRIQKENIINPK